MSQDDCISLFLAVYIERPSPTLPLNHRSPCIHLFTGAHNAIVVR